MRAGTFNPVITGGNVDEENRVLRFTDSGNWVYTGAITKEKHVNGTTTNGYDVDEFWMTYNDTANN